MRTNRSTASPHTPRSLAKGYDPDHFCDRIAETGGEVVIPPKRNRTVKRPHDTELYKERNMIKRFFNKRK